MRERGDERVDLLKFDVEGSEYDVVPTLPLQAMGVQVLGLELHHDRSPSAARDLLAGLRRSGYLVVHREASTDFTLVRDAAASSR